GSGRARGLWSLRRHRRLRLWTVCGPCVWTSCTCLFCGCPSAHPFGEGGACPAEFRVDDDTAVAAVRVRGVEVLVDILGGIERAEGFEGGHDRIVEEGLCGFDGFGEMLLLGLVAVEHGRPVLGADVVALTVEARGV